jgi:colicin import membrane protein
MRARGSAHASLLLSSGTSTASIGRYVAASLALHVLFFIAAVYLPDLAPKREFVPSVIMVNMVTMSPTGSIGKPGHPGPETPGPKSEKPGAPTAKSEKPEVHEAKPEPPAPKPAKPEAQEPKPVPPAPKPEKVPVPEPKPPTPKPEPEKSTDVISLSNEKPKIKTSLKKETFKSNQVIKNALNRIEKQVDETKTVDPLASALDRIKSKVAKEESETSKSSSRESGTGKTSGGGSSGAGGSGGGTGGTGGTGAFGIQPIDFYKSLIPSHIENNWVFNEQLVGGRSDLVSVIVVKIMKNGEITDIWFEKKSGNSYFDDSVYKAVKKSNPLPPLPREYTQPYYELGLIFTPKGLKRS